MSDGRQAANEALEVVARALAVWTHTATFLLANHEVTIDPTEIAEIDMVRSKAMTAITELTTCLHTPPLSSASEAVLPNLLPKTPA